MNNKNVNEVGVWGPIFAFVVVLIIGLVIAAVRRG